MTIEELIKLTTNKLHYLTNSRTYQFSIGNVDEVTKLDELISITEQTLNQLKSLR
jgi:hypothetical protein